MWVTRGRMQVLPFLFSFKRGERKKTRQRENKLTVGHRLLERKAESLPGLLLDLELKVVRQVKQLRQHALRKGEGGLCGEDLLDRVHELGLPLDEGLASAAPLVVRPAAAHPSRSGKEHQE